MKLLFYGLTGTLALAALAQAQSVKVITDTQCQMQVPGDWTETKTRGTGARSPEDRTFQAVVRGFDSSDYKSVVDSIKQVKNSSVADENGRRILLVAPGFGGKKQYDAVTKTNPLGCLAHITFAADKEPVARKIADSLKPAK